MFLGQRASSLLNHLEDVENLAQEAKNSFCDIVVLVTQKLEKDGHQLRDVCVCGGVGGGRVARVVLRVGVVPNLAKLETEVVDKASNLFAELRIGLASGKRVGNGDQSRPVVIMLMDVNIQ